MSAIEGHRVAVYYQTQYDNSLPSNSAFGHYVSPLPLLGLITHLFLAAFHINTDKSVHLNDNLPEAPFFTQMWQDLGQMQDQGVKLLPLTTDNFDTYYPILANYITEFNLDGMDLDVEQSTSLSVITNLITRLKSDFGADFIITLAPVATAMTEGSNLSGFDYITLEQQMGSQISWYNAQFYSGFGTLFPDTQYIDIINFGSGLDPNRLVASVLTSPANGDGYVSPDEVVSSVQDLLRATASTLEGSTGGHFCYTDYFNSNPNSTEPWLWAQMMSDAMASLKEAKANVKAADREPHDRSHVTQTVTRDRGKFYTVVPTTGRIN
ncbi:endo-beta-N-acetylglucosaminidase [Mycena rosella]|uniref:Endo-beta-N-acetylglucosaminidase n=1 Tax=Mycena rosella TaxID=1033263 RepID=A0AAD7D9P8_MYCRO|nr:endo-beta-N-acetylglucosaminidase [Mycena rosella]